MKYLFLIVLVTFLTPQIGVSCTMYKTTIKGKTIVGNNEDWVSPNSQFWFEAPAENRLGVMYMGLLNNFAQGAINEAGLMFDGFANPYLPVVNTAGKENIYIGDAIRKIMQTMRSAEEVKEYLEKVNLSSLTNSMVVFVDQSGTYLIVEGDELIVGEEPEKAFSNFYYSQIESEKEVTLDYFQNGQDFQKRTKQKSSLNYCGEVMKSYSVSGLTATQYSTIYDLNALKIRVYLYHDYAQFVDLDLRTELAKGDHKQMIPDLFPKDSPGHQFYQMYNDEKHPTKIFEQRLDNSAFTEEQLVKMDFDADINIIGYEWLYQKKNPAVAIQLFKYGIGLMPNNADLHNSLGEAYLVNDEWNKSIKHYAQSLVLEPQNDHAIKQLAKVQADKKKYKEKSFKQLTQLVGQYANNTLKKGNINSLALAIYKNGITYQQYYGEIDPNQGNIPNEHTLYEIASISKVFVGSLAAKAVLERKIALGDDIRKYLGEGYPNLEFEGTPVTIKDLLTHTLGFETPKKLRKVYQKTIRGYYEDKAFDYNMDDLLEELKAVKVTKKPGTYYDYNNVGPELVAYILEKVHGKPYKALLQEFLDQLEMKHTYLQDYNTHKALLSNGYGQDQKRGFIDKNPLPGGAFGIITTLPDLTKFIQFQLENKAPFIKESSRFLFQNDEEALGYLWDLGIGDEEGFYYVKTGTSNGTQSAVLICPDSDYGMVLIMNNKSDAALNDWLSLYNRIEHDLIQYPKINLWSLVEPTFMKNPEKAFEQYRSLKSDSTTYYFESSHLNNIGYDFLYQNQTEWAIAVFEFAISEDPQNANLYDSLGEAYFVAEDYKNATHYYKKSLELNPENTNAKKYLLKMSALQD